MITLTCKWWDITTIKRFVCWQSTTNIFLNRSKHKEWWLPLHMAFQRRSVNGYPKSRLTLFVTVIHFKFAYLFWQGGCIASRAIHQSLIIIHVNSNICEQGARIRVPADEMDVSRPAVSVPTTTTTSASDASSSKSIAECHSATSTDVVVSDIYR